jgi:hypothetical protein
MSIPAARLSFRKAESRADFGCVGEEVGLWSKGGIRTRDAWSGRFCVHNFTLLGITTRKERQPSKDDRMAFRDKVHGVLGGDYFVL